MAEEKLKVGIIGCGEIATNQVKQMQNCKRVAVSMAMDVNEALARDMGEKYGIPHTTRLEDVLESDRVDAVYIATPHHLHAPLTMQAAQAGKHVMVEKPISTNLGDADRMMGACKDAGVKLSVCFINRYRSAWLEAKKLLDAGLIGKVLGTTIISLVDKPEHYWHGGYSGRAKSDWRVSKEQSGGGMLIMNAVHTIDQMLWLTGLDVKTVYSIYDTFLTPVEVEDYIVVVNRYVGGAIGLIHASSVPRGNTFAGDLQPSRVYGSEGQLALTDPLRAYTLKDNDLIEKGKWQEVASGAPKDVRRLYADDFAEAVFSDKDPFITGEDGRKTLEVIVAAYRSGETGQPVELPLGK